MPPDRGLAFLGLSQRSRSGADTCHYERANSYLAEALEIKALTRRTFPGAGVQTVRARSLLCSLFVRKSLKLLLDVRLAVGDGITEEINQFLSLAGRLL